MRDNNTNGGEIMDKTIEGTEGGGDDKKVEAVSLVVEVADRLKKSAPDVRERVIQQLVEVEVKGRVVLLDGALQARKQAADELKKLDRPDLETFDGDGKPLSSAYSKGQLDKIRKAREALVKIDKAIDGALTVNDWGKLKEIKPKQVDGKQGPAGDKGQQSIE